MSKPNILYIHSHDTGRYIQPYGYNVPTPRLQQLAEEGVLFRENFCINPTCSASRASLLTGSYPHENGMTGLAHRGFSLNDYGQHIIHCLKKHGYASALSGTQHIATKQGDKMPYEVIGYDQDMGRDTTKGAIEFLENTPEDPFFLAVGYETTHRGFPPLEESPYDPRYCMPPKPLPDTPKMREDMCRYMACAKLLDDSIGQVMDALEKSGKADNTLVICTTDHGIAFPRMKCNLQDSGIETMLIMRGPGGFKGGQIVDGMTTHLDIYPTICDVVGIEEPDWLRGKSLVPYAKDQVEQIHEECFFEVNYHAAYEPMRAVRTSRYKYIRRFEERKSPVLVNCDAGESKTVLLENGWQEQKVVSEMLFDLIFDPNECNNLANDEASQTLLTEMRDRLQNWMKKTDDPLLNGSVPKPEGARINSSDDVGLR